MSAQDSYKNERKINRVQSNQEWNLKRKMEEEEEVHVVGMISLILEASLNPWSFLYIKKFTSPFHWPNIRHYS